MTILLLMEMEIIILLKDLIKYDKIIFVSSGHAVNKRWRKPKGQSRMNN
jgi:hypothetical protein